MNRKQLLPLILLFAGLVLGVVVGFGQSLYSVSKASSPDFHTPKILSKKLNYDDLYDHNNDLPLNHELDALPSVIPPPLDKNTFDLPDLDVTYIERTPRYFRYMVCYRQNANDIAVGEECDGTRNRKHYPDVGEPVVYTAHIKNKGVGPVTAKVPFTWKIDDQIVKRGMIAPTIDTINSGEERLITMSTTWTATPAKISFTIDPGTILRETAKSNNTLTINSVDLSLSIFVENGLYNLFNSYRNLSGTFSFEDWLQVQIAQLNQRLGEGTTTYPLTPNGVGYGFRVDKIVLADDMDSDSSPFSRNNDPDDQTIDGRWKFSDGDSTNRSGLEAAWLKYVSQNITSIDWTLIHELVHQLGAPDLYRMNVSNDPIINNRVNVTDMHGKIIDFQQLPDVFPNPGIMGGGNVSPHIGTSTTNSQTYFDSHTAKGFEVNTETNTSLPYRRGFYAEYLYDTPVHITLRILDDRGLPVRQATIALYQKNPSTEAFDNIPQIVGSTDENGEMQLPNRSVSNSFTTVTGHTLHDNPFGTIDVVGRNGSFLVKITKGQLEDYRWLTIVDVNLAYWSGQRDTAVIDIQTNLNKSPIIEVQPTVVALSPKPSPAVAPSQGVGLTCEFGSITGQVSYGSSLPDVITVTLEQEENGILSQRYTKQFLRLAGEIPEGGSVPFSFPDLIVNADTDTFTYFLIATMVRQNSTKIVSFIPASCGDGQNLSSQCEFDLDRTNPPLSCRGRASFN